RSLQRIGCDFLAERNELLVELLDRVVAAVERVDAAHSVVGLSDLLIESLIPAGSSTGAGIAPGTLRYCRWRDFLGCGWRLIGLIRRRNIIDDHRLFHRMDDDRTTAG